MDKHQQQYYLKDFRIAFLESRGNEFQKLFKILMEKAYPNDFMACRPWGNIGDRKNDGYLPSKRMLFQVYAPNKMKASEAIQKINEDFEGAKKHWKQYFDHWIFVHNAIDGLSPPIIERLLELKQENPEFKVGHWGYEGLRIEFLQLNLQTLETWFGMAIDTQSAVFLGYTELEAVLQHINLSPFDKNPNVREVSQGKIEANLLSPEVAEFLKIGMMKYQLVKDFFKRWRNPKYETQIALTFNDKYSEFKEQEPPLHPDLIFARLEEWAGGTLTKTPKEKAALLAILAYLFEQCEIFEDAQA